MDPRPAFTIQPLTPTDNERVAQWTTARWGAEIVVAHGQVYTPSRLPGFAALQANEWVGLVTYNIAGQACEIVTLDSLRPNTGIGSALIEAVSRAALQNNCRRLWLITTNDNLNALRFYQKRGFSLVKIHRGAVDQARQVKPIPLLGEDGIPIHDEIELEKVL